mgnify:CR=1 FL=1
MRRFFTLTASLLCLCFANPNRSLMQNTHPETTAVSIWLTLPDRTQLLQPQPDLLLAPTDIPAEGSRVIVLDSDVRYQQMEGFGAALTDSSAWNIMHVMSSRQREQVMHDLFTREGDGIGLSYVRIPIGASDFSLHDQTYNDLPAGETDPALDQFSINYDEAYIIPALLQAQALNSQLRFMGSPWSAPAWMKNNGALHGGSLLPDYYPAFADYLVRWIQAYDAHGLNIDTLTPQNEPLHMNPGYPTMGMTAEAQQTFVRDYLGPALAAADLDTRLLIFDHNWDLADYPLTVLEDPAAAAYVDGIAFHCYGGSVSAQSRVHEAHSDKGIWFTECSGGDWAANFGDNLSWNIRNLVIGNFRNWGNSVILWNLVLDQEAGPQNGGCGDCRGVVTINQVSGAVTYNEEYYVLGHVSRFVDPGAYRIDSTEFRMGVAENVAFVNPDGSLVLIAHSVIDAPITVTWQGQQFEYELPAGALVTFKWGGTSAD